MLESLIPTSLLFSTVLLLPVAAQDSASTRQGAELDSSSRVKRSLTTLLGLREYSFLSKDGGNGLAGLFAGGAIRIALQGGNAKKRKAPEKRIIKKGPIYCWTVGKRQLFNHGRRWLTKSGESWVPSRTPKDLFWRGRFLPDPGFLAERLLDLLPKTKWELLDVQTLEDRPVRAYKATLEDEVAAELTRCGAIPGGPGGGFGGILAIGAGGAIRQKMKKGELKVELFLYEHPATHVPLRLSAKIYSKANKNVQIMVQGAGLGNAQEEEDTDQPKPSSTLELDLERYRRVKAPEIPAEARRLLKLPAQTEGSKKAEVRRKKVIRRG